MSLDPESRRRSESLHLRAKSLLLNKVEWREWRIHWKKGSGNGRWRRQQSGKGISDNIGRSSNVADGEVKF